MSPLKLSYIQGGKEGESKILADGETNFIDTPIGEAWAAYEPSLKILGIRIRRPKIIMDWPRPGERYLTSTFRKSDEAIYSFADVIIKAEVVN